MSTTTLPAPGTSCATCRTELHHDCRAVIEVDGRPLCASCDDGVECPYMKTVRTRGLVVKATAEIANNPPPEPETPAPAPKPPKAPVGVNSGHRGAYKQAQRAKALDMLNKGVSPRNAAGACGISLKMVQTINTERRKALGLQPARTPRKQQRLEAMERDLSGVAEVVDAVPLSPEIEAKVAVQGIEDAIKHEHELDVEALDRLRAIVVISEAPTEEVIKMFPETDVDLLPEAHTPKVEDVIYTSRLARPTCTDDNYAAVIEDLNLKIEVLSDARDLLMTLRGTV